MKKFFTLLGLSTLGFFAGNAQTVDLEAFATIAEGAKLCPKKFLSPTENPTGDSIHGIYGILFNGPDDLVEGDQMTFRSSFHHFLTQAEADEQGVPFEDKYAWYSIYTLNQNNVDNGGLYFSYDSISRIGMLVDWDRYEEFGRDSLRFLGPPHDQFVPDRSYGFFVRTWGLGASASAIVNTDPDMANNFFVVKIIWDDCGVGIADMIAPKAYTALDVYPNPASQKVSFKHTFDKNTNMKAYVRDMTGRTVKMIDFGHVVAGDRDFTIDISGLSAGNYVLEMNASEKVATGKFTVQY